MSWGLDILTKDLDGNEVWVDIVDGHTYNLTAMWAEAVPFLEDSRDFDGKKCADVVEDLKIGFLDATLNPDKYRALEPDSNWGDYEGFYEILTKAYRLCAKHPSGTLVWNG